MERFKQREQPPKDFEVVMPDLSAVPEFENDRALRDYQVSRQAQFQETVGSC